MTLLDGRRWLACAVGVLFVALATGPLVLGTDSLYWGDVLLYFQPMLEFVRHELGEGRLPLWNPYVLCGQPFVGNPQSALFYPATLAVPAVDAHRFLGLSVAVHMLIAWSGTYRYLRAMGLQRTASALAASTFAGGGAFVGRLQFPMMIQALAWMPWVLWAVRRVAVRQSLRRTLALAASVTLCAMAGHPQMAYMVVVLAAATVWPQLRGGCRDRLYLRNVLLAFGAAACLTVLLSAPAWLPALQALAGSSRAAMPLERANRFVFLPEHLLGLVSPGYFGDPAHGNYWGAGNAWEPSIYVGVLQLALAGYALYHFRRHPEVRLHLWVGAIALWLALGIYAGLYTVAFYIVPGMRSFHDPARLAIVTSFCLAVLAALGLAALGDIGVARRYVRLVAALCVATLLPWTAGLTPSVRSDALEYRPRGLAVAPRGKRVYSAARRAVWDRYVNYADYGPESKRYVHELTDTLAPNLGMRYRIEETGGYEPVPQLRSAMMEGLIGKALSEHRRGLASYAALTDTGAFVLPLATRFRDPELRQLSTRGVMALAVRAQSTRAWLVHHVRVVASDSRALMAMSSPRFDPTVTAVTSSATGVAPDLGGEPFGAGPSGTPVVVHAFGPHRVEGEVQNTGPPALLVFSMSAAPGWQARIDGRHVPLVRANVAFMAVVVRSGSHRVALHYEPAAVRAGIFVGLIGLSTLVGLAAYGCPDIRRAAVRAQVH